jgi:hypothetical protein
MRSLSIYSLEYLLVTRIKYFIFLIRNNIRTVICVIILNNIITQINYGDYHILRELSASFFCSSALRFLLLLTVALIFLFNIKNFIHILTTKIWESPF